MQNNGASIFRNRVDSYHHWKICQRFCQARVEKDMGSLYGKVVLCVLPVLSVWLLSYSWALKIGISLYFCLLQILTSVLMIVQSHACIVYVRTYLSDKTASRLFQTLLWHVSVATKLIIFCQMYHDEIDKGVNGFYSIIMMHCSFVFVLDVLKMINIFLSSDKYMINSDKG